MKKLLIIVPLVLGAFYTGVYFENNRLVGEPDTTIAVMLSELTISNTKYQLQLNSEYLALIESGLYEELNEKINSNNQLLSGIKIDAESVCSEVECTKEQISFLEDAMLLDLLVNYFQELLICLLEGQIRQN